MYVGPRREPTWLRSTREASHFGVERSSSRFKGLVTRGCSLLTSRPVKGMEYGMALGEGIKSTRILAAVLSNLMWLGSSVLLCLWNYCFSCINPS